MKLHTFDRLNLLLALVLAVLLGLGYWQWRDAAPPPLTQLLPEQVNAVELYQGETLRAALLKSGDGWQQTLPDIGPANARRVRQLLGLLQSPSLRRLHASGDLKRFGLRPPRYQLVTDQVRIGLGDRDPTSGHRYALVNGKLHLINDAYVYLLQSLLPGKPKS